MNTFLSFWVCGERFAVPVDRVEEILRMAWPAPVAGSPPDVLGVLSVGGRLTVVLEPAPALDLEPSPLQTTDYLLVLGHPAGPIALRIQGFDALVESEVGPVPDLAPARAFVLGYLPAAKSPTAVLDLDTLLTPETRAFVAGQREASPGSP